MSETQGLLLKLICVRRLKQSLDRYEWDAKPTVDIDDWDTSTQTCTDMTETPKKIFIVIFDPDAVSSV